MKIKRVLLVLSLGLNVALAATLISRRGANEAQRAKLGLEKSPESVGVKAAIMTPSAAPLWSRLASPDLDELAQRLKTAGFSRGEILAIMMEQISTKFRPSRTRNAGALYWKNNQIDYSDPKIRSEMEVASRAYEEMWRKYVDVPGALADDPERLESARRQYGKFSPEKLQAIALLETEYQEKQNQSLPKDATGQARYAMYLALQKEKEASVAALLSPAEYAEYELRASNTAQTLRSRLENFKPTEDEYKAIFAINKAYSDKLSDLTLSPESRKAIMDEMNTQAVAALGADRAADYQEVQRGGDKTASLIARLDLPPRVGGVVRNIQQDTTQRAAAIRTDATLSLADRSAQLSALAQTARTQLTTALGERGFEAYNDMKGDWIRALQPK